jgi:periplasmic divalent cation tolerance protein
MGRVLPTSQANNQTMGAVDSVVGEMSEAILVFMTAPSNDEATRIAEKLVGLELAPCVQVLPQVMSVYRWQGRTERQPEVLLIAKTLRSKFEELDREVRAMHSYDVPEVVAVLISEISSPYLHWLTEISEHSTKAEQHRDQAV